MLKHQTTQKANMNVPSMAHITEAFGDMIMREVMISLMIESMLCPSPS